MIAWPVETPVYLAAAHGDLGVYVFLCAIRATENGGPGRELGVLDSRADTLAKQAQFATNTIRHYERDAQTAGVITTIRDAYGLYGEDFLIYASHRYAPLGADNDPHALNHHHAKNLTTIAHRLGQAVSRALLGLAAT